MPTPVILDCDPGHDDALAILLAAANPAVELLAVTTVAGNQTLDKTTLNARRVATLAGLHDLRIAAGADRPLHGRLRTAPEVHGQTGLDGPAFADPTVPLDPQHAVAVLREILVAHPEPVTLVPTGPLTNIAALLVAHPDVRPHIREIVLMGGSTERGNVTPYAEFNSYVDPEAADIVFSAGLPVTMCGLNITHQALATADVLDRIRAVGTPLAATCVELLTFFADRYRQIWGFPAPPLHDPVAVARVIDPAVVETVPAAVRIECAGTYTRGATVVDLHHVTGEAPNAEVAHTLHRDAFWDLIVDAIAALG